MRIARALWRWHFYAGLISAPFFLLLAVTGAVYLFEAEIDRAILHDVRVVEPGPGHAGYETILASAQAALPGAPITRVAMPVRDDLAIEFQMRSGGEPVSVFVDPYSGAVTGMREGASAMEFVLTLHSLTVAGPIGNRIIEAVAGWVIILFGTGIFLWWPRKRTAEADRARPPPTNRQLFRTVHVYTGLSLGGLVVFLALTGLPWSEVWGGGLQSIARQHDLGMPAEVWGERPQSDPHAGHEPWVLEDAHRPASRAPTGEGIGMADAIRIAEAANLPAGFTVDAPWTPTGVFTAMALPADATAQRVLHIDRFSGEILMDIRYSDYGVIAQAVELGVSLHTGEQFGLANKLVMLLACLALMMISVSSILLSWRRRNRSFKPPSIEPKSMIAVSVIICAGLIIVPLTAVSAAAIGLGDWGFRRFRRASAR